MTRPNPLQRLDDISRGLPGVWQAVEAAWRHRPDNCPPWCFLPGDWWRLALETYLDVPALPA